MVELMQIGATTVAATIAIVVAFLPRTWLPATVLAGLFIPVLIVCVSMVGSRLAFGSLSGESGNAVGELDLWLLGLAFYAIAAAALCLCRVLSWIKSVALPSAGRLLDR